MNPAKEGESLALARMSGERATPADTAAWLARNAVDSLPEGGLERKLAEGRPLRVKLGIDPTAPDIHLGHTVVLRKLREFQDLGHLVVLIIGDYTARVGDPSGRSDTRPMLSPEQIDANALTFQEQALKILDRDRIEVHRNGEWLDMPMDELFRLARTTTVAQILERDDFAKRQLSRAPISLLELLYPLLQGYDSVEVKADVELGGTDQKFNLLLARDIQRAYGVPEQAVLTMPILPGTDGERRMSKSLANYIGVSEPPAEIYGKTLSIPDSVVPLYYELLLRRAVPEDLAARDAKRALARDLVAQFYDASAAQAAEREFDRVHREGGVPDAIDEVLWPVAELGDSVHLPELLRRAFGVSTSEARRALGQGGVSLDGEPVAAESLDLPAAEVYGKVLKLGKRRFALVRVV
jgi:tyrosyl-tRNA synthetase